MSDWRDDGPPEPREEEFLPDEFYSGGESVEADVTATPAPTTPTTAPVAEEPEELKFLVEPRLLPAEGIHLLGGAPMAGKSTILAQILRQFVSPDPLFLPGLRFAPLAPAELGVIFTDRSWRENSIWFRDLPVAHYALTDDPEAIRFMHKISPGGSPGADLLRFCLDRLPPGVKFVVADVFTNAFVGNLFHHAIVHRHMVSIQRLLHERHLALLGTCYGTKLKRGRQEQYQRAIDRIIGAAPFRGSLSSILYLEASEESEFDYQRLSWYTRHGREQAFAVQRGAGGRFFERRDVVLTSQVVQDEAPAPAPAPRRRPGPPPDPVLIEKVLSLIAPGEALSRPVLAARATNAGVARATAYTTFKRLQEAGQLVWDEAAGTLLRPATPPRTEVALPPDPTPPQKS